MAQGIDEAQTILTEQTLYRTRPDVSIDGRRFVYSSTAATADQFSNLYVQPTSGGEPYKMTFFTHDAFHPRWSPDGEWIAYVSNAGGLPQLALLETYGGAQRTVEITDPALETTDGRPDGAHPPRRHRSDDRGARPPDGIGWQALRPRRRLARVSGAGDRIFHSTGTARVELPVGTVNLTVLKGFEFWPQELTAEITAGDVTMMTVDLDPMTDMAAKGWYSGSTHVHMNYAGNLHNTIDNLMMMSDAEDQDIVNEQIANKDNRILDQHLFVPRGRRASEVHPRPDPRRRTGVSAAVLRPRLHVRARGSPDLAVHDRLRGHGDREPLPEQHRHVSEGQSPGRNRRLCSRILWRQRSPRRHARRRQGFMSTPPLGTTDAVEWSGAGRAGFFPVYAAWNNGLRVTAVGGEDSISNLHASKLVGSVRTYVHTGERGLAMDAWFEGPSRWPAFVSTGPLVELTVDGAIPGETVDLRDGGGTVEIRGWVRSITPIDRLLLVWNGQVIEEVPVMGDRHETELSRTLPVTGSGWYHLRVEGRPDERFPLDAGFAQAFTNPVWVTVGGRPVRSQASAEYALRWIDTLQELADAWPGWRSERERAHVFAQFEEAREVYRRFAAEANP